MRASREAKLLQPFWNADIDRKIAAALSRTVIFTGQNVATGGGGTTYTAGDGIDINASDIISVDVTDLFDSMYGLDENTNNLRINLASPSSLEFGGAGALRIADTIAGAGLAISSKVLEVTAGDGIDVTGDAVTVDVTDILGFGLTESSNNIDIDPAADFTGTNKWTAVHDFHNGLTVQMVNFDNTAPGDHVAANGYVYYDQNVDDADVGGNSALQTSTRGGLVLYNADDTQWGLLLDTTNMDVVNSEWNSVRTADLYADADLDVQPTLSLNLIPTDDVYLNPGGLVLYHDSQESRTNTFKDLFAGIQGFRLWERASGTDQLTISKLKADELHVRIFVADETRVDRGEEVWSKSYGITAEDFTLPSVGNTRDVWFEDAPGITGNLFSTGDYLLCQIIDWGTGLIIARVWFTVTASLGDYNITGLPEYQGAWATSTAYSVDDIVTNGGSYYECDTAHTSSSTDEPGVGTYWKLYWQETDNKDWQEWRLTRESGGGSFGMTVPAGSLMVDVGQAGQGFVHLSALEDAGGPFIQMGDWDTSPNGGANLIDNWNIYTRMGNLNGFAGYVADTWGFLAGHDFDSATQADWTGIVADENGIDLYNTGIEIWRGTSRRFTVSPSGIVVFGRDIENDDAGGYKRSFIHAGAALSDYLGEVGFDLGIGDIVMGDWFGAHLFWDFSAGVLYFRDYDSGSFTERAYVGTDGKIYAGAGAVWLDEEGVSILGSPTVFHAKYALDWLYGTTPVARIYSLDGSTGTPRLFIQSGNFDGSVADGWIDIRTYDSAGNSDARIELLADSYIGIYGPGTASLILNSTEFAFTGDASLTGDLYMDANNKALYMSNVALSSVEVLKVNASDDLIIGAGVGTSDAVVIQTNGSNRILVDLNGITMKETMILDGDYVITTNPPSAASTEGWKISMRGTGTAIGAVSTGTGQMAVKVPNWFSVYDSQNPTADATTTAPDSTACFAVSDDLVYAQGDLGESSWTEPTLQGNWEDFDTVNNHDAAYKIFGDMVFLRGIVGTSSGTGNNTVIFYLPAGYRPDQDMNFVCIANDGSNDGFGKVLIQDSDGAVKFFGDATNWMSLDGLSFHTSA